jgi:hypothetical protein
MPRTRRKERFPTPLEDWVLNRFGGTDAKQAISEQAEKLVEATGINLPPVCIVKLAKVIGVDPWPIYEPGTEGAIKVIDGRMKIVLRKTHAKHQASNAMIGRTRFTYAHELGHALFYDLETLPPVRLAPTGFHRVEEQLCNRAASHFLIPEALLRHELSGIADLSPGVFRDLARTFQVSIQAIAYRIAETFSDKLKPNQFVMISASGSGLRGAGVEKPRCVVCILAPDLSVQNIAFLRSHQGIDRVRRRVQRQSLAWSLEEYFQREQNRKRDARLESEEVIECPCGSLVQVKVCHTTMDWSRLVWSEGTMKVLELSKTRV